MCTTEDALSLAKRSPDGSLVCRVKKQGGLSLIFQPCWRPFVADVPDQALAVIVGAIRVIRPHCAGIIMRRLGHEHVRLKAVSLRRIFFIMRKQRCESSGKSEHEGRVSTISNEVTVLTNGFGCPHGGKCQVIFGSDTAQASECDKELHYCWLSEAALGTQQAAVSARAPADFIRQLGN